MVVTATTAAAAEEVAVGAVDGVETVAEVDLPARTSSFPQCLAHRSRNSLYQADTRQSRNHRHRRHNADRCCSRLF